MENRKRPTGNKRGLTNRRNISNAIDKDLFEKFDNLSAETMIPKSKLLDQAVELLLKKYGKL